MIGNPPYVRQESIKASKEYLSSHYDSASGTADLYVYFLEKAVRLLREDGYASYIVSSSFLKTSFAKPLRETLKRHASIIELTDFGGLPVFENAKDTYVCIPVFRNSHQPNTITIRKVSTLEPTKRSKQMTSSGFHISHSRFSQDEYALRSDEEENLYRKS